MPEPAAGQEGGGTPATYVLRAVPETAGNVSGTAGPAQLLPGASDPEPVAPAPVTPAPGTVSAPTGEFGPAPEPAPAPAPETPADAPVPGPDPDPLTAFEREDEPYSAPEWKVIPSSGLIPMVETQTEIEPQPAPDWKPDPTPAPGRRPAGLPVLEPEPEHDPKPTPARGFDAVAEAVLAPATEGGGTAPASPFEADVARINEAVKQGRIEEAAGMAERTVAEASASWGPDHSEVLKLRELTSYIAYLAGDPLRSFHLSLDLARLHRRLGDPGAAYGNVQSAAAAWRAVRDPLQGLHLGRDLIGVWTELTADEGPAAEDLEQLDSARNRMGRLAERARSLPDNPYTRSPRPPAP
ncbi:tetratricopeptide repeat protein [Streptomyces sp. NPDC054842]